MEHCTAKWGREVKKLLCAEDKERIYLELILMGFKPNTAGMQRVADALELCTENPMLLGDLKHRLYPAIAVRHGETVQSVERIIRYTIERVWLSGELDALQERFGYTIQADKGKPTNRAFLAQMTEWLILHGGSVLENRSGSE